MGARERAHGATPPARTPWDSGPLAVKQNAAANQRDQRELLEKAYGAIEDIIAVSMAFIPHELSSPWKEDESEPSTPSTPTMDVRIVAQHSAMHAVPG